MFITASAFLATSLYAIVVLCMYFRLSSLSLSLSPRSSIGPRTVATAYLGVSSMMKAEAMLSMTELHVWCMIKGVNLYGDWCAVQAS